MRPPLITLVSQILMKAAKGLVRDFGEVAHLQSSERSGGFVLAAARRTESFIHQGLHQLYPSYNFLIAKSGLVNYGEPDAPLWILDPLDGSKNFLHGLPYFAISLALRERENLVAGMIYDPLRNDFFWAYQGAGAFLNQTRLRVSGRRNLGKAIVATGSSQLNGSTYVLSTMAAVGAQIAGLRSWGALGLDLAYVAAGRYDGFWDFGVQPWDMAAGILLVKEAGGFITNLKGQAPLWEGDNLIAGSEVTYNFLKTILTRPDV